MLAACEGGDTPSSRGASGAVQGSPSPIELIQGSWRGNLTERPRECLGMNDSQAPIAKSAIHKITVDAGKISVQDEVGQIYRGAFIAGTDFDASWAISSASTVEENSLSYRNLNNKEADVLIKRLTGTKGATCLYTWSGKMVKQN